MASNHEHHNHSKKGSLTNIFSRLFKPKDKRDSQNNLHDRKEEKDRKNTLTTDTTPSNDTSIQHHTHQDPKPEPKLEVVEPKQPKDTQTTKVIEPDIPSTTTHPVIPDNQTKLNDPQQKSNPPSNPTHTEVQVNTVNTANTATTKNTNPTNTTNTTTTPPTTTTVNHGNATNLTINTNTEHTNGTHKPQDQHTNPPPTPRETEDFYGNNQVNNNNSHDYIENQNPATNTNTNNTNNNNNNNNNNSIKTSTETDFVPLPFYEGSPKTTHNSQQPPKPRNSGPPEILPEEIEYDTTADFLGQGSFGSVYKGRCRGQEVAVKIPRKQKLSLTELTNFRNEVKIMSKIYHPNVVLFLGACTQTGKMQIVTERCMTDLEKLLASKRPLSLYERMRMAKDAALGMNWLHGITRIVHNDLKSANLLVDNHMRVKVTDFGFSSIKEGDQFVDKAKKGTPLWMAPEVMMGQPYDDKADVYSFGIILWEIVTRDIPYKHHTDYNTFSRAVCHDNERPPLPADIMPSLKYLITSCWDHNSKQRPSFNEIVFRISEVMVECMIENESARLLWKKYFLLPKQELQEQIPWADFAACISVNLGLKSTSEAYDMLGNVKRLLITMPRDTMGLINEIVTMDCFDKVIKWFGMFFDPIVGPKVNKEINTLANQGWFHWDISRDEATSRLAVHDEGTFLIRLSSTDPKITPFTLSLTGNQHRRIKRIEQGYKLQGKPKVYSDLLDLVANCEDYKLLTPCPKIDTSNPYAVDSFL